MNWYIKVENKAFINFTGSVSAREYQKHLVCWFCYCFLPFIFTFFTFCIWVLLSSLNCYKDLKDCLSKVASSHIVSNISIQYQDELYLMVFFCSSNVLGSFKSLRYRVSRNRWILFSTSAYTKKATTIFINIFEMFTQMNYSTYYLHGCKTIKIEVFCFF